MSEREWEFEVTVTGTVFADDKYQAEMEVKAILYATGHLIDIESLEEVEEPD